MARWSLRALALLVGFTASGMAVWFERRRCRRIIDAPRLLGRIRVPPPIRGAKWGEP